MSVFECCVTAAYAPVLVRLHTQHNHRHPGVPSPIWHTCKILSAVQRCLHPGSDFDVDHSRRATGHIIENKQVWSDLVASVDLLASVRSYTHDCPCELQPCTVALRGWLTHTLSVIRGRAIDGNSKQGWALAISMMRYDWGSSTHRYRCNHTAC